MAPCVTSATASRKLSGAHLALPYPHTNPSANAKHSRTPLKNKQQQVSKTKEPLFPYAPKKVQTTQLVFVELLLKNNFIINLVIRKLCLLL